MSVQDPKLVETVINSFFSKKNPPDQDDDDLELRLNEALYQIQGDQTDVDSLDEEEWRELLAKHGFDEDELVDALEIISGWGVIDDHP